MGCCIPAWESANLNGEVYVGGGTKLFAYDVAAGTFVDADDDPANGVNGADLISSVGEIALGPDGRFAFVLDGSDKIGVVQVQRFDSSTTPAMLAASQRFATYPGLAQLTEGTSELLVKKLPVDGSNPRFAVYTTSSCIDCLPVARSSCPNITSLQPSTEERTLMAARADIGMWGPVDSSSFPGGALPLFADWLRGALLMECMPGSCEFLPDPPPGGGGSGSNPPQRDVYLGITILEANLKPIAADPTMTFLDPNSPWTEECTRSILVASHEVTVGAPAWDRVGVALSTDTAQSRVYVVSPDTDEVVIYDAATGIENARVTVGTHPFDVTAMVVRDTNLGMDAERVYVVNHGHTGVADDDTMSIVDPAAMPVAVTAQPVLNDVFQEPSDLSVNRIAGSEFADFLFLVSPDRQKVLVLDATVNGDAPTKRFDFPVGRSPGAIALQGKTP